LGLEINPNRLGSVGGYESLAPADVKKQKGAETQGSDLLSTVADKAVDSDLSPATQLRSELRRHEMVGQKAQTGISILQTANTGLTAIDGHLNELGSLVAKGDTGAVREHLGGIDNAVRQTEWSGRQLLDGTLARGVNLKPEMNDPDAHVVIPSLTSEALGLTKIADEMANGNSAKASSLVDKASRVVNEATTGVRNAETTLLRSVEASTNAIANVTGQGSINSAEQALAAVSQLVAFIGSDSSDAVNAQSNKAGPQSFNLLR
jgi:hypothetical protein